MMCVMAAVMEGPLADLSSWRADDCSIAKAMDLIGTRSAVLILREAYYGTRRFDGFAARVGITDAAAAAQLRKLTAAGVLAKQPYQEEGKRTRHEYVLTPMGRDLLPAILALMQWGDAHLQPGPAPLLLVEEATGAPVRVEVRSATGKEVELEELGIRVNEDYLRERRERAAE
ncbi:transcriptional regulator, HxlR family [Nocardia amikacinitolerans]|uniref:Transcriptional regulator, HxlR family n=1 Tax=Nocardia amikacinitolerans TaxID=756689 RepID=A0A285LUY6_9NOCA|nr:transcriptional regulator, HxlR family [Nocardia amikacinitolerans]MCP2295058.1 transcriptional regulator, HxlR family [Nocardia amikacinitolerans]SNY87486.1 transcriptional regulator, HxlR family [Nocardia amikacinitolerans]